MKDIYIGSSWCIEKNIWNILASEGTMTTINCTLNCIHQQDGLCGWESVSNDAISGSPECAFFKEKILSESWNGTKKELESK